MVSFTGDGAYDQDGVYASVAERHPDAAVIVPPRATAVPSETAESAPTQRDRHLQHIAEQGRMAWQRASGYTKRAKAEAAIGRWKQVIGDRLRAHTEERRATEVEVAGPRAQSHAGAGTPDLRPHCVIWAGVGVSAAAPLIPAPRCSAWSHQQGCLPQAVWCASPTPGPGQLERGHPWASVEPHDRCRRGAALSVMGDDMRF